MKLARWFAVNTAVMLALIAGVGGFTPAWLLVQFIIWFIFTPTFICHIARVKIKVDTSYLPIWLDRLYDVVFILILVCTGHWFYATLYLLAQVFGHSIIERDKPVTEVSV